MPENYNIIKAQNLADDQNLEDSVRDQINQALEDVDLIEKVDDSL